jgi:hypothetical protein
MTKKAKASGKTKRNYSPRILKLLWGRAAGRCAMPECRVELFVDATEGVLSSAPCSYCLMQRSGTSSTPVQHRSPSPLRSS